MYCRMQKNIAIGFITVSLLTSVNMGKTSEIGRAPAEMFSSVPIVFIENVGQIDDAGVRYCFYGKGANVYHTTHGPVFEMAGDGREEVVSFGASFPGSLEVVPVGQKKQDTTINYFVGSERDKWHSGVSTYGEVVYEGLYEGIDLHTFGRRSHLKYEFHVGPEADYSQVAIRYDGIDRLFTDDCGALHVVAPGGELIDKPPYVYQVIDGQRKQVAGKYKLIDECTYGFEITGEVDGSVELVIDPELMWVSFVGSSDYDYGTGISIDSVGNILVVGETRATVFYDQNTYSGADVFVASLSSEGQLQWTTFLGGGGGDYGFDIAVDGLDNIVVTGITSSVDFALRGNSYKLGSSDAFAAKLDSSGNLLWSTYLGGNKTDRGFGVAVDGAGNVVVAGYTESKDFDLANNYYKGGSFDGFVAMISPDGVGQWASYMGGNYSDHCEGVAIDGANNYVVTGTSSLSVLPRAVNISNGAADAFVAVFGSDGILQWSSYLGGSATEHGLGVAISGSGAILVAGDTESSDFTGASNSSFGQKDAFVAIVNPDGTVVSATYIGGSGVDIAAGICEDMFGNIIVAGRSNSSDLANADNDHVLGYDAFAAALSPGGTLILSTYLGGGNDDLGFDVAVDAANCILVTGATSSSNFGDPENTTNGSRDGFIARIMGVDNNMPDLVVTYSQEDVVVTGGEIARVEVEIENTGSADAVAFGPGYFSTTLYLSSESNVAWESLGDSDVGAFELSLLNSGDVHAGVIEFVTSEIPGVYYLRARTDDFDSVPENREYNNWGQVITLTVNKPPGEPDLIITEVAQGEDSKVKVVQGEEASVGVRIENIGDEPAVTSDGSEFLTSLYLTYDPNSNWDELVTDIEPIRRSMIAVNGSYPTVVLFSAPAEPGIYYVRAKADDTNVVAESDEGNNWGSVITLEVEKTPAIADLVIVAEPDTVIYSSPDEIVNVAMDIQNIGDANALPADGESITVSLYIAYHSGADWDGLDDRNIVSDYEFSLLQAGEILDATIIFDATSEAGDYYLRARVDDADLVDESYETNNWGPIIQFVVLGESQPDLMVAIADSNDISARPREIVDVTLDIVNTGDGSAIPVGVNNFNTLLYIGKEPDVMWDQISDANSIGFVSVTFLEPSEMQSGPVSFMAPFEHGTYYLRADTDVDNTVAEGNEFNNLSSRVALVVSGMPIVNQPPVLEDIGNMLIGEGRLLNFAVTADDPDGDELSWSVTGLPVGATFNKLVFNWIPDYEQEGEYVVTFDVTDSEFIDSREVVISVTNTNRPPVFYVIRPEPVNENEELVFTVAATDPDGDPVTYAADNLPEGATFIDRTFSWTPNYDQQGEHAVRFIASDSQASNSEDIDIVIISVINDNRPPVAEAGEFQNVLDGDGSGGELVTLDATGSTDPDNDIVGYSWSDNLGDLIPKGANPIALLSVGYHTIMLTVTDSEGQTDTDFVNVQVNNSQNQPPIADAGDDMTVQDTDSDGIVNVTLSAAGSSDADGSIVTYLWQTDGAFGLGEVSVLSLQAGTHVITLTVIDNKGASDEDTVTVTVESITGGSAPILSPIGNKVISENESLSFVISAFDAEDDFITYSAEDLPEGAMFVGRTFAWIPNYQQEGQYVVTFKASDGRFFDSESIVITVLNMNRPPIFSAIDDMLVDEGSEISFTIGVIDPDGDSIAYAINMGPPGARLNNGTFSWTPNYRQAGDYIISFVASDRQSVNAEDIESVNVTVNNVNSFPVAEAGYDQVVLDEDRDGITEVTLDGSGSSDAEGAIAEYIWEVDGDSIAGSLAVVSLPIGIHTITLTVVDYDGTTAEDTLTVTVNSSNSAPVLSVTGDKTVAENTNLSFEVIASDNDGDELMYSAVDLPAGATFEGGIFSFRPWYGQMGSYVVTFIASDGIDEDFETITITTEAVDLPAWYRKWLEANGLLNK